MGTMARSWTDPPHPENGTRTFLRIEDSPHEARLRCIGSDLSAAEPAFDTDVDVQETGNLR